jgi:putative protease
LYDHDIIIAKQLIDAAKESGVDAIIAFDFAAMNYCNEIGMPVHATIQFSISNYEAVKFFSKMTNRIILARELTLDQIKDIHTKIVADNLLGNEGRLMEIEVFGHGALCIAQSGRCWMSLYTDNASANRGACLQNCRHAYKVTDLSTGKDLILDNQYIMSAADICTIDFLDKFIDAGVSVLKVEGRGRSPEYVYTVISTYKKALKDIEEGNYTKEKIEGYLKDLETVFNRKLSHGNFFLGKEVGEYSDIYGSKATEEKVYKGRVTNYFSKQHVAEITLEAGGIKVGEKFLITGNETGVSFGTIDEIRVDFKTVPEAPSKSVVSIKVPEKVRKNDMFYIVVNKEKPQDYLDVQTKVDKVDTLAKVEVKIEEEKPQDFSNIQTDKKNFIISQQRKNCIGCGSCVTYSPSCWKINKKTGKAELISGMEKGKVVVAEVAMEHLEENKKAATACPMQVIKLNKE